jgi:hypothetical protein
MRCVALDRVTVLQYISDNHIVVLQWVYLNYK